MSNKVKRIVTLTENELVNLIDKLVTEVISSKKKEWIAEQENKKKSVLESKVIELEKKFALLTESKK